MSHEPLLTRHLGSEAAAADARRAIDRRAREDTLRYRQLAAGPAPEDKDELHRLREEVWSLRDWIADLARELRRVREEMPETARREARALMADELPEALDYRLNGRQGP
jgi:hypothetical protein